MFALSCEISRAKRGLLPVETSAALQSYRRLAYSLLAVKELNPQIKAVLEKQLRIFSERSETACCTELQIYTEQIINLVKLLDPELRSQPYVEELSHLPSATITMSDLEEIAAARKEKLRLADKEFRHLLGENRKTTPSPRPESVDTSANPL